MCLVSWDKRHIKPLSNSNKYLILINKLKWRQIFIEKQKCIFLEIQLILPHLRLIQPVNLLDDIYQYNLFTPAIQHHFNQVIMQLISTNCLNPGQLVNPYNHQPLVATSDHDQQVRINRWANQLSIDYTLSSFGHCVTNNKTTKRQPGRPKNL